MQPHVPQAAISLCVTGLHAPHIYEGGETQNHPMCTAGAHKLFRGELHKLGRASCQNLTGQIDDLRSGFGEWLVKERCEAAPPT